MNIELNLFDQPVNHSLANKIDAFYSKDVKMKRPTQKEKIFLACKELGLANDRMLSQRSGVPLHLTPDRRARLVADGKLRFWDTAIDTVTDQRTNFYEVVK